MSRADGALLQRLSAACQWSADCFGLRANRVLIASACVLTSTQMTDSPAQCTLLRCGWPRQSVKALQTWIKDQGAEPGPIDGCWGRRTSKALQSVLNARRAQDLSPVDPTMLKETEVAEAFSATVKEPLVAAGVPLVVGVPPPKAAGAA